MYGPEGTGSKIARFSLSTTGPFLDLSTLCVVGTVHNNNATVDRPLEFLGPSLGTLVQTARVLIGGVEVDKCDYVGRTEGMLGLLQSESKRRQDFSEGFGFQDGTSVGTDFRSASIAHTQSRKVVWKPKCLGILQMQSYLPIALASGGQCTLELQFVDTAADVCYTQGNHSTQWSITALQVCVDTVSVDSAFLSSLGSHLAQGGSIGMHWKSYMTSFYSILAAAAQIQHSRAHSRLNTLMLTFLDAGGVTTSSKAVNRFFIPATQQLKMFCQVGEQRFPSTLSNDCLPLFYHRLLGAIGASNSAGHAPCLTSASFAATGFIAVQDFEMVPGQAHHSGINTYASPLNINLENIGGATAGGITQAYVTTYHDVVLEMSAAGVVVST